MALQQIPNISYLKKTLESVFKNEKRLLAFIALFYLVAFILIVPGIGCTGDVAVFYEDIWLKVSQGHIPYKDFDFGYPPGSLPFFLIPGLVSSTPWGYSFAFAIQILISYILTCFILYHILKTLKIKPIIPTLAYLALSSIYFFPSMVKFDTIPALIVLISVWYFLNKHYNIAYCLIIVAALVKIYPIILLPLYFIFNWYQDNHSSGKIVCIKWLCTLSVTIIIAIVALRLIPHISILEIFQTSLTLEARSYQIESTVAVVSLGLGLLGIQDYAIVEQFHTYDVISPLTNFLNPLWAYYTVAIILIMYGTLILLRVMMKGMTPIAEDRNQIVIITIFTITFILINKVFSTQFVLWILPLMCLCVPFQNKHNIQVWLYCTLIAMMVLSRLIPDSGCNLALFEVLNILRDGTMLVFAIILVRFLQKTSGINTEKRMRA